MSSKFSFNRLNPAQKQAVQALHGPVLILAGAGTGKTHTVTCRIANMVQDGIAPRQILAVTFTNKAANEMRERVGEIVSKATAKDITVCTFHSLCVRILRQAIGKLGYKENFSIYATSDQTGLLNQLIVRHGAKKEKISPYDILAEMSRAKNAGGNFAIITDELIRSIATSYQAELKRQNAVDFDDLLILAEQAMREHEDVRQHWRKRFHYITVDEFQDTNSLQMSLLRQLVGPERNVCVVGDDDQSIYGWRGAQISNILDFESFFHDPIIIKLEENYRCAAPILDVANALIKHNTGRRDKKLIAKVPGNTPVRLVAIPGAADEADFIVNEISTDRFKTKRNYDDYAILFRTNTQSRLLETSLRELSIPYRVVGVQSFFDRKEVKDLISYLSCFDNPAADTHLLRILNMPPRGISDTTAHVAIDWSRDHKTSVWDALCDEEFTSCLSTRARTAVTEFTALITRYRTRFQAKHENYGDLLSKFITEIELEDYVERNCKTEKEATARAIAIGEVKSTLHNWYSPNKPLHDFLAQITLDQSNDEDDDIEKKKGVCLITMHAAKGLEFPVVFIAGLEEGILPHKRSIDDGTCDEERRIFYVAITRAKERLVMTYCSSRIRYGQKELTEPSSFISQIPANLLEFEDYEEIMNRENTEEETADFFAQMRELLAGED